MPTDFNAIDRVGVVGAGTIGSGISQVTAVAGYDVVMRDIESTLVEDGLSAIDDSLRRIADAEELTDADAIAARDRITGTTDLADLSECDLVVEAVLESLDVKRDVFGELDEVTDDDAVLASNTSTLSITTIAAATERRRDRGETHNGIETRNPVYCHSHRGWSR